MHQAGQQEIGSAAVINYRLLLQYDGSDYAGWQIQTKVKTIQGTICRAIERIAGEPIRLIGSGRTDAGVHARGQVANFQTRRLLEGEVWKKALNRMLPADIRVRKVNRTPLHFHARKSAVSKVYIYRIFRGEVLPPWQARYCLYWPYSLQPEEMQQAAQCLLGAHDMRSFAAAGTRVKHFMRTVYRSEFRTRGALLCYHIEADGFLQHMVRTILGTLLEVGRGRFSVEQFAAILAAQDRRRAGPTAPACGLFLDRVFYRRHQKQG